MAESYRQAKRIRRAIWERWIKGLVHGHRGQPSKRRIDDVLREEVLGRSKGVPWGFNEYHYFLAVIFLMYSLISRTPSNPQAHENAWPFRAL